jgi:replicative DNA helicase
MNARLREDHDLAHLRVPPQSIEAEQAVLGGLMLAPDALPNVADLLTDSDFYRRDHQLIWTAIVELEEKKRPYDAVTLGEWFESHGQLELVAGGAYLIELASTTPSAANIRAYAEIVRDKALLRAGIEAGTAFVGACYQPGGRETSEILAEGAARVARLTVQGAGDGGLRMVRAGVAEAYEEVAARYNGTIDVGLTPPWSNVRQKLPGLEDTDFCVVAGRPGMGKTIVGLEWAYHAAMQGRNVAFFSLEMSRKQLIVRMMSRHGRVDSQKMRMKGALSDEEWTRLSAASRDIKALPLAIDDTARMTSAKISARASRMHAKVEGGLGLIVIDYLQLAEGTSGREDQRQAEITKISRDLKLLAKTLRCPVIALSQLNRSLESRTDKRPVMSDLRESGAIEQDADVVAFIYRDDYYSKDQCGAPGVAEFIIGKQRNGPTGTAYLRSHLEYNHLEDYHGPKPIYAKPKGSATSNDGFDDDAPPQRQRSGRDRATGDR